jgi:adenylate kinase family enzyme
MNSVISISGPPGSGKSSVAQAIAKLLCCELVHYDDYPSLTSATTDEIQKWVIEDMPFAALFIADFKDRVMELRISSSVIVETPLGPLHEAEGLHVDFSIWLECDYDIALTRALSKILEQENWSSNDEMREWAHGYLQSYLDFVAQAVRNQRKTVRPKCMLVLDAHAPLGEVIEQALEGVRAHMGNSIFYSVSQRND